MLFCVCLFLLLSSFVSFVCGSLCVVVLFVFVVCCVIACHLCMCLCGLCLIYCVLLYGLFCCVVAVVWAWGCFFFGGGTYCMMLYGLVLLCVFMCLRVLRVMYCAMLCVCFCFACLFECVC